MQKFTFCKMGSQLFLVTVCFQSFTVMQLQPTHHGCGLYKVVCSSFAFMSPNMLATPKCCKCSKQKLGDGEELVIMHCRMRVIRVQGCAKCALTMVLQTLLLNIQGSTGDPGMQGYGVLCLAHHAYAGNPYPQCISNSFRCKLWGYSLSCLPPPCSNPIRFLL